MPAGSPPKAVPRSRCCRRANAQCTQWRLQVKWPELPLLLAGLVGGPVCIFLFTPFRNALSVASHDVDSSAMQIYQSTFRAGGWAGGHVSAIVSAPGFLVMGPAFHLLKDLLGSNALALGISGLGESIITYGSQARNSKMAMNREYAQQGIDIVLPLKDPFWPWGPGVGFLYLRNVLTLSGIRVLAPPIASALARTALPAQSRVVLGDVLASLTTAAFSMPLNQLFNYAATSPEYWAACTGVSVSCMVEAVSFCDRTYLLRDSEAKITGVKAVFVRDVFLRCMYVGWLYIAFASIERFAIAAGRRRQKRKV